MNPALLLVLLQGAQAAIAAYPQLLAEFEAIKAAGSATPADLASINAQIATIEAQRQASWAAADAALTTAAAS